MANDLALSLKITGDASQFRASVKEAVASLESMRRAQLESFRAGKDAAEQARTQWRQAEEEIKRLAIAARQSGIDQGALNAEMQKAQAIAVRAKAAWLEETQALHQRRSALTQNATALAQVRNGQMPNNAGIISSAFSTLGVRSQAQITAEIASINRAMETLRNNSAIAGAEMRRALAAGKEKIAALNAESGSGFAGIAANASKSAGTILAAIASLTVGYDLLKDKLLQADAMKMLEGRLKLAAGSLAGMNVAMQDVTRIADANGQAIEPVATLYSRLSRAIKDFGYSQNDVAEVTEAVTLALRANGSTAAESASAMLQLSQSFAAGRMQGEEFNAVQEAAPTLIKAIANELKVTQGEVRQLASEGKVSAEVMVNAYKKALPEFRKEAAGLPSTMEQGWQRVTNAQARYARELDRVLGLTNNIARAFDWAAKNSDRTTAKVNDFFNLLAVPREFVASKISGMDIGKINAEYESLTRLVAVHKEFNQVIASADGAKLPALAEKLRLLKVAAMANPGADINRTIVDAQGYANAWITAQQKLNTARENLMKLMVEKQRILAGQETLTAKEAIDKQIRDLEKLKATREANLQKALSDLQKYRNAVVAALQKETDIRSSTADRIRELKRKGMSEEEQQADIKKQAYEKLSEAEKKYEEARKAAARGDTAGAEKYAAEAEKLSDQASSLGERLKDTGEAIKIIEKAGNIAANANNAVAEANQRAAKSTEGFIESTKKGIADLTKQIEALTQEKKAIEVSAKVDTAIDEVGKLQKALDAIQNKEVTVTMKTVEARAAGGPVGFARGGALPGYGGGDRIPAILEAGEYVVRKEAVRKYGFSTLHALNAMRVPLPVRAVHGLPRLPASKASSGDAGGTLTLRLQTPYGAEARVRSSRAEAENLVRILQRAGVKLS